MIIKKVSANTFDVFWDIGWEKWARMHLNDNNKWELVAGLSMPKRVFHEFRGRMYRKKGKNMNRGHMEK